MTTTNPASPGRSPARDRVNKINRQRHQTRRSYIVEECEFLRSCGVSWHTIARQLGLSDHSLEITLRRARNEGTTTLHPNDPEMSTWWRAG